MSNALKSFNRRLEGLDVTIQEKNVRVDFFFNFETLGFGCTPKGIRCVVVHVQYITVSVIRKRSYASLVPKISIEVDILILNFLDL